MTDYAKYKTDKVHGHNYMAAYEHHFAPFWDQPIAVMEIGIEHGHSMEMWQELFTHPDAKIVGFDLGDCKQPPWERVRYYKGDMKEGKDFEPVFKENGRPTIIIDDASHKAHDSMPAFAFLYEHLLPGGLYVVEDIRFSDMLSGFLFPKIRDWPDGTDRMTIYMPNGRKSEATGIVFIEKGKE